MIHERPDGTKLEVRRKTPHHATVLQLEGRELKRDGTPHDDNWYPVSDSLLLGLQEAGSDIVSTLASANHWNEKDAGCDVDDRRCIHGVPMNVFCGRCES